MLLVGCLRQGLALARDFRLNLDWLADAAWAYVSDSVWEPLAPPVHSDADNGMTTAADALVELLTALARRQHETVRSPPLASPPSHAPDCCPLTCTRWPSTTSPRPARPR